MIDELVINPEQITITDLAEKLGVSRATIYNDFKDPEFQILKNETTNALTFKGGFVKAYALNNVIKDIVENGNVATSKWWLENIEGIKDQDHEPPIDPDPVERFREDNEENLDELTAENAPEVFQAFKELRTTLRKQGMDPDAPLDEETPLDEEG